jgi:hypothetical protein
MKKKEATPTRTILVSIYQWIGLELHTCKDTPNRPVSGATYEGKLNLLDEEQPSPASVAQDSAHG